mmetsp:Transcript_9588/g.33693  ORF Transcript_9588/g.33693 Transcript_9588/m.33693 type:complete len:204 (+) Transcript_9588:181-792(+)
MLRPRLCTAAPHPIARRRPGRRGPRPLPRARPRRRRAAKRLWVWGKRPWTDRAACSVRAYARHGLVRGAAAPRRRRRASGGGVRSCRSFFKRESAAGMRRGVDGAVGLQKCPSPRKRTVGPSAGRLSSAPTARCGSGETAPRASSRRRCTAAIRCRRRWSGSLRTPGWRIVLRPRRTASTPGAAPASASPTPKAERPTPAAYE